MRNLKEWRYPIISSVDITLTLFLKLISDFHAALKLLSPLASITFVILNVKRLFVSWKPIVTCALFIPALMISPSFELVRFILSACILWIFFDKMKDPEKDYPVYAGWLVVFYVVAMAAGILNPSYYYTMDTNSKRYMFILESHNALTVTTLICLVYLTNIYLSLENSGKHGLLKWSSYISIFLTCLVLLFIKSRIYISISFVFILLLAVRKFRQSRPLALAPVIYLLLFAFITISPGLMKRYHIEGLEFADNQRVLSSSGTGRMALVNTFIDTYKEKGWQRFLFQNNVKTYYDKKAAIPGIDMRVSTLTESSYLILLLYTGFLGLLVFLLIFATYLWRFLKNKEYLSLTFMCLLLAAWLFEETVLFPFSMIVHLFALATLNRLETKKI